MTRFTVATWNVNSLRVRLPHVLGWLAEVKPDVLALQETKLPDTDFPVQEIQQAGYVAMYSGQRTYNGVAILSRWPMTERIVEIPGFDDVQRRLLGVTIAGRRILNLYVPNGESVTSEKYQYKLNWLKQLNHFLRVELKQYTQLIVLGDFNIAPEALDVYDPKEWEGRVLYSEPERQAFHQLLQLGLHDCFRLQAQTTQCFSWWDYRLNAFKRNRGLRIDHILMSQALVSLCVKCVIDQRPRAWERPSDHAPVVAEFVS